MKKLGIVLFTTFSLLMFSLFFVDISARSASGKVPSNGTAASQYAHFKSTDNGPGVGRNKGTANVNGCFTATVQMQGGGQAKTANGCFINPNNRVNTAENHGNFMKEYPWFSTMGQ